MLVAVNGWFSDQLNTGSGQYLAGLAAWLPQVGEPHTFALVRPRAAGGRSGADHDPAGWRVEMADTPFDGRSRNLAKLWFEQLAFPSTCRRLRADVALVPYWGSSWWRPCPVVVTIHDLIPLLLPAYRGGPLQRAYTWLVGQTARRAAAVLTDSQASRRDIVARLRVDPGRVHAVHLAADPGYRPITAQPQLAAVRERYRLPEGPFLLYLGGFDRRKNVVRLIEAYGRLVGRTDGAEGHAGCTPKLVIAGKLPGGDSPFAPDPRPVVERLGLSDRVHFTGWVDDADKAALYSLARAAVFASEYEGFGLPVLEAQASGCPLVTSRF